MQLPHLTQQQKDTVWRYAHCAALWRRMGHSRNRSFASLESDMAAGYEIIADGIAIDGRPSYPVVIGDAKDPEFVAAIFRNDNRAIPEMRAVDLEQLRRHIVHGEGELPMPPARLLEPGVNPPVAAEGKARSRYS
jgi:hypothetical protein